MALNWYIGNIKDHETVCFSEYNPETESGKIAPVTEALIWRTMAVGIGKITAKNARKFYERSCVLSRLDGAPLIRDGKPRHISLADVEAHIGLSTNVSTETDAQWRKRMWEGIVRESVYQIDRETADKEAAA